MKKKLTETVLSLMDIDPKDYSQKQRVSFECPTCGGKIEATLREVKYKKGQNICGVCRKSTTKAPVLVQPSMAKLDRYTSRSQVSFYCSNCGKLTEKTVLAIRQTGFLCQACASKATFLRNHGTENPFDDDAFKARKKASIIETYGSLEAYERRKTDARRKTLEEEGIINVFQRQDVKERSKLTKLKGHGDQNFNNRELAAETRESRYGDKNYNNRGKAKETFLQRYGADCTMHVRALRETVQKTNEEKFGGKSPFSSAAVRDAARATKKKKYGNPDFVNPEKTKKTMREKYGDWFTATESGKQSVRRTCLDRYGVPFVFQSNAFKDRSRQSFLERFGETNNMKSAEGHAVWVDAFNRKYGADYPSQVPEIRRKILGRVGMSGPEKKMEEFLTNRGIPHEHNYLSGGKHFDFAVFDGSSSLKALVEIDGEYFHGLLSDTDGKHVRGDHDSSRFGLVPDGVAFVACDSKNIEGAFTEVLRVLGISYEDWISEIIASLPAEFPFPEYADARLLKDWESLKAFSYNKNSLLGNSIISRFHRSIWSSNVGDRPSPLEAWSDKKLLEKCVRNRFIYSSSLSSQAISSGFNVCKIAPKVSVFRAPLAKRLVETYLGKFDEVFDPFSGFSGRMLGTCATGKRYVGRDISEKVISESLEISEFLGLGADLRCQDILTATEEKRQCLFTCSPYGAKESWGRQSQGRPCDDWIDICLEKYDCEAYLFVVDETTKYAANVVESIQNVSHFGTNNESVVLIIRSTGTTD